MLKVATLSEIENNYSLDDLMDLHDVIDFKFASEQAANKGGRT
jgi:hypothetical protein